VPAALLLRVRPAMAAPEDLVEALRATFGERSLEAGRVQLDIPAIVENGNVVPLSVSVDSPMTAGDYVAGIFLFAERNPLPRMAAFSLTPRCGRARITTRVRLADSQQVLAVAEMSDGRLFSAAVSVEVSNIGCGG
jgi:sulfur-oxidizing protein SoxY